MESIPRRSIAIVDDESSVRRALARLLRASGFEVHCYASGSELLESLATHRPDCVLLDMHMADLSGAEVQKRLKSAHPSLPTIVITAHDAPGLRERCLNDGAVAFLRKPLRHALLLATIANALRSSPVQEAPE